MASCRFQSRHFLTIRKNSLQKKICVGTLTPPVGAILFAGCRTHQVKIEQITGMLMPFFAVILIGLLMITYIPALSMWLPNALGLA